MTIYEVCGHITGKANVDTALPPPTPTTNNSLERSQFIDNDKHGLERSQ